MRKIPCIGDNGLIGWNADFDDLADYREAVAKAEAGILEQWGYVRPEVTTRKIAYQPPGRPLCIVTPAPAFFLMLRRGNIIRHMRVIDENGRPARPVFEGSGELMPSMTEDEALEFLAWRDVPRGINHVAVIDGDSVPADRSRRNDWYLADDGRIAIPA